MTPSIGTLRGLQQIATTEGIFTITAMDQRGALKSLLNPGGEVSYEAMREAKVDVVRALSPHSTAILIDPQYGAAEVIAERAMSGSCGLIVAIEQTGYTSDGSGRLASLIPDWSVAKIKRMGAQAVKLLVYYHPDEVAAAGKQRDLVARVLEDCRACDLPLVVEAVAYPLAGQDKAGFAAGKPEIVIRTAEELAPIGFDLYKAEFPVDMNFPHDEAGLDEWCRRLDSACAGPWIILSAGVGIDLFARQVEIACRNGASGFLAGRAIWKDYMKIGDRSERQARLGSDAVTSLRRCADLAIRYGRPFYDKMGHAEGFGAEVREDWHRRYAAF